MKEHMSSSDFKGCYIKLILIGIATVQQVYHFILNLRLYFVEIHESVWIKHMNQTLLWSLEFVIQVNLEHGVIAAVLEC